jgi:DNA-binding MarR family transcriptional regulator
MTKPADTTPRVGRDDLGFLLAKAMQRWNELLSERFAAAGYGDVRPSYGSALLPLFEQDGLRMGELAERAYLSKQAMTEMVRRLERDGLVERRPDPEDGRASLIFLTRRSRSFEPVAEQVLADLDRLVRRRLRGKRVDELKAGLRDLLQLERSEGVLSPPRRSSQGRPFPQGGRNEVHAAHSSRRHPAARDA